MEDFTIRVTPEQLRAASEEVSKKAGEIRTRFEEMKTKMQQTSSCWTGDAAELHRSLFEKQVPAAEEIAARFTEQAGKLSQIAGNYLGAQGNVAAEVEQLPVDVIK